MSVNNIMLVGHSCLMILQVWLYHNLFYYEYRKFSFLTLNHCLNFRFILSGKINWSLNVTFNSQNFCLNYYITNCNIIKCKSIIVVHISLAFMAMIPVGHVSAVTRRVWNVQAVAQQTA